MRTIERKLQRGGEQAEAVEATLAHQDTLRLLDREKERTATLRAALELMRHVACEDSSCADWNNAILAADAALAGSDGWIPVSERLPADHELVLAVGGAMIRTAIVRGTCWLMFPGGWAMKPQPTHWRPLPAPPAAKEATT